MKAAVYRSKRAAVLNVWRDFQEHHALVSEARKEFRRRVAHGRDLYVDRDERHVVGVAKKNSRDELVGWKPDPRRGGMLIPDGKTPEGKVAKKALADPALVLRDLRRELPGMPDRIIRAEGGRLVLHGPAIHLHGTYLFASWGIDPESVKREWGEKAIDESLWERIPLSRYYRMLERAEVSS